MIRSWGCFLCCEMQDNLGIVTYGAACHILYNFAICPTRQNSLPLFLRIKRIKRKQGMVSILHPEGILVKLQQITI